MTEINFDYSNLKAFQGYLTNEVLLKSSASGGAATALSHFIIENGGVVFGSTYSSDFKSAEYFCAHNLEELEKLKGSKYIFTRKEIYLDNKYVPVFPVVGEYLSRNVPVLFTGLGCDIAAVKKFLDNKKIDTTNLYLVDLICHGPTEAIVAEHFISQLEKKYSSKITSFSVRYKKDGWVPPYIYASFSNGKEHLEPYYESDYNYAFTHYSRKSCYSCKFKGSNHVSDITIGDYWGINESAAGYNKNGVSVFIVSTSKGEKLINKLDSSFFTLTEANIEHVLQNNPMYFSCRDKYENYEDFENSIKSKGLHYAVLRDMGLLNYWRNKSHLKKKLKIVMKVLLTNEK